MGVLVEVVVILAAAVAAYIFVPLTLPVAVALAGGLVALLALMRGDATRYIAAVILLVLAGLALIANSGQPGAAPPAPIPPREEQAPPAPMPPREELAPPAPLPPRGEAVPPAPIPPREEVAPSCSPVPCIPPRPARPRVAYPPAAPPAGRLALFGSIRMVRQGTCPYGWRTLWPDEFSGLSPPASPAPLRPRRWRHDPSWDDCSFRTAPPPWFNRL